MLAAVVAADQCPDVSAAVRARLVQLGQLAVRAVADAARVMVVEDHAVCGRGPGIGWQQGDFGRAVQHDHFVVAPRPDANQRRSGPGVDQSAAGSAVQHRTTAVGRIDQTRDAHPVLTGQDRGHPGAVPGDQLGGPVVFAIDAPGHPVVGIGGDDPDLAAGSPAGRHLAGQPLSVRGVDDPGDRALDR